MQYAVELRGVRKLYGSREVLAGVDLLVGSGEIHCLVGPNGAGKTTTLRIIATLARPSSGSVRILGVDVLGAEDLSGLRRRISYLPEEADVYARLSGEEYLRFFAEIYGIYVGDALELGIQVSGLSREDLRRRAGTYSRGMRRRLLIARALITRPELAILDEPTSGLDVFSALHVREALLRASREVRASVILSSHNMLEVEHLCERVSLMDRGRIVSRGRPAEIVEATGSRNLEEAFAKIVGDGPWG